MIAIRHLDKTFNRGKQNAIHVINDVTLDLPASGMVAIFGRSGCGKTTLLNVIGGLDRVQGGSVEIDGERMTRSSDGLRNRSIGYIFQNYCLNREETCRENVADALRLLGVTDREFLDRQVDAALRAVGMERFASRLPDTLSGGQQQRIAIARAIVKNPPVILADEPTGNLDEQNTLHVMRLLKAISQNRLVLLVTHEENLVTAFSDRVIELSDGRVVSDTENTPTEGYTSRDKNAVYLGELPKTSLLDGGDGVTLDYYGDAPAPGVKLRLVKTGDGRVYLKIDAGKVNVLDETSEVKLVNGAAPKAGDDANGETGASPALAEIKPVKARRAGRLFGFGSAWKSGVRANLGQKKRGRKVLRNALILFAAVVVFMTASLGVFVRNLADVDATYHHHLIYAYAGDEISAAALAGIGEEAGVVYRQFTLSDPSSERTFSFSIGNFETFSGGEGESSMLASSATAFLRAACEGRRLLAGKNTGLADDDALITEGMAKALLKEATVDYLRTYDDLIGVWSNSGGFRVAGVVEGDDREVFLSVERIAYWSYGSGLKIYVPSSFGTVDPPADGKATVILPETYTDGEYPKTGDVVQVNGKSFEVDRVIRDYYSQSFDEWCVERGYELPELTYEPTFAVAEQYMEKYAEYLTEKIDFFGEPGMISVKLWYRGLIPEALYWAADELAPTLYPASHLLAYRSLWREAHPGEGSPDEETVRLWAQDMGDNDLSALHKARRVEWEEEYYDLQWSGTSKVPNVSRNGYLLNEREAEAAFLRVGKTTALYNGEAYYGASFPAGVSVGDEAIPNGAYLMLRTTDPEKTAAKIEEALGDHYRDLLREDGDYVTEWNAPLYTPADFRQEAMETKKADIVSNASELGVFLAVMSLCMYLMMRASMMGRIREIGIYRAIGVSRGNLVFRFFVEALAVTTLTVFVGYLFSTVVISAWLVKVPLIGNFFYYPAWMALAVLGLLYGIGAVCGTLPVMRLLRKTPSEILSKYDI